MAAALAVIECRYRWTPWRVLQGCSESCFLSDVYQGKWDDAAVQIRSVLSLLSLWLKEVDNLVRGRCTDALMPSYSTTCIHFQLTQLSPYLQREMLYVSWKGANFVCFVFHCQTQCKVHRAYYIMTTASASRKLLRTQWNLSTINAPIYAKAFYSIYGILF